MSLSACPDCGGNLGKQATKCRCGWKSPLALQHAVLAERKCTPCAADPACRYPGLLWVRALNEEQRICIEHYYQALNKNPDYANDNEELARKKSLARRQFMPNVNPKPVSGA